MKKSCLMLTLSVCLIASNSYAVLFSDDFEDGTLDKWIIEVSENGRGHIAEVIDQSGDHRAHLYKDGMFNVGISKVLDYQNDLHFSFDMQTELYSEAPEPDSAWGAIAGVHFYFLDSTQTELGRVAYLASTSTLIGGFWLEPTHQLVPIEQGFSSHEYDISEMLANITIEESEISHVMMVFRANNTGNMYNMNAHAWIDNVIVTPEPTTLILLGMGGLILQKNRK